MTTGNTSVQHPPRDSRQKGGKANGRASTQTNSKTNGRGSSTQASSQTKSQARTNSRANGKTNGRSNPRTNGKTNGRTNPRANGRGTTRANGRTNPRANGRGTTRANGRANPRANGRGRTQASPQAGTHNSTQTNGQRQGKRLLRDSVSLAVGNYLERLDGNMSHDFYEMVMTEVEIPLLEQIMRYTRNNQTKAALMLGLNRGTLRKKLMHYGLL